MYIVHLYMHYALDIDIQAIVYLTIDINPKFPNTLYFSSALSIHSHTDL